MVYKLVALALTALGAWSMHSGIAARETLEPTGFVAGAGFIPGTRAAFEPAGHRGAAAPRGEVRSSVIALVSHGVASAGSTRRAAGFGLLAGGLALAWVAAFGGRRGPGGPSPFPWLPTLILIPGAYLLFRLGVDASARAPSAQDARAASALWGPAAALALILILARSGTARARPR